ncbi:preprotein translocase subunit SecG [Hydromonas duriensis]|uniref:Protein-export membrane protein SecG n=1 Tax=Hydromonas duriensis TaxID=1527608 RepID=A0A4R6Y952_9BURK|nr:preprotein translocase subunit SecG [Hydromonas duriensis]TDR31958.1 protein translocase subunit secG [Hydromonas duriensis]
MGILKTILIILQVVSSIGVIVLVLLQQGKGADAGASFGGGASGSVFGSVGSANFLSRTTAYLATLFIVCTVLLAFVFTGNSTVGSGSVLDKAPTVPAATTPVAPTVPAPTDGIPK